jgi:MtaA/CmuA family methyltransferase
MGVKRGEVFLDYNELKKELKNTKSEMSPKERSQKYFAGERVDHIPYSLHLVYLALAEIHGYTTSQMNADFDVYAEIIEKARDDLGIEGINVRLSLRTMGAAMGSTLHYPEHGIDRIEEYILQDYEDWGKMTDPDPYNNKILTPMLEQAAMLKKRFPDMQLSTGVVGPLSTAVAIRPIEKILRDTRKNPEKLRELIALGLDNSLKWVEVFTKEFGPATASISDPVTCTDIISRSQFEEFSFPELKRLVDGLKEITGLKPSLHICGHTKGIWEDLKELEISSFSVDNCEDLGEVCEALGDTFPILGNVPPVEVLRQGTIDDVIESVKDCICKGATSPKGYTLATGCQVPLGTPRENLEAFVYAARKYGRDAKVGELPKGLCFSDK